ncbi:MAG: IS21 family transposase [Planctomycetota bacterium]|jgi:transposase
MANQLKMAKVKAILGLREQGWSCRRIARELGVHRETVRRYVRLARDGPKPANPLTGSEPRRESKPANPLTGSRLSLTDRSGPASACEPYRAVIIEKLDAGLTAQRVYQDLKTEHGFQGSYSSVQRYTRRLRHTSPRPFRRMECEPGAEVQVDFGRGAPIVRADGVRRRTHVLRMVLSHSRKAYSEVVYRQTTEEFIRCLENAFWAFGGVPRTVVIDNLRAAVSKADWYDPELNPKLQAFCEHAGTVVLPTRPYTPRHKGKVERGIGYVQDNALKGRQFNSLQAQNEYLQYWERTVADTRIHGTTRKHVREHFEVVERPALLPLPAERFPFFHEARRRVNRDGHVEVQRAFYSAPPEYVGHDVWVRWDSRLVRLFNHRFQQLEVHVKKEPGQFSTKGEHILPEKTSAVERGAAWMLQRAALIGPHTRHWSESMMQHRGVAGLRVLQGLLSLARQHQDHRIEQACEVAQSHGAYRLRVIRQLITRHGAKQDQFEFTQDHPIIRSLADYGQLVRDSFTKEVTVE